MGEGLATLSWLDFASWDRERALDIIAQLREKETRDELGLGVIRDGFSDRLFPGTSTLQTRARYFLFVPWIYQDLERRRTPSSEFALKARRAELRLCEQLLANGEHEGVIGRVAGRNLKRLPSSIYWLGLESWGIKLDARGQADYVRGLDRWYARQDQTERILRGDEAEQRRFANWDSRIPAPPDDFAQSATLALTRDEAKYLADKIGARHADSLLFRMIASKSGVADVSWPWEWEPLSTAPDKLQALVSHARNFSLVTEGAVLLYNLILAEMRTEGGNPDLFRDELTGWVARIEDQREALAAWNIDEFHAHLDAMELPRGGRTRRFVDEWLGIVMDPTLRSLAAAGPTRSLIRDREIQLKGGLARVRGGQPLELWSGGSGLGPFNYRWQRVGRIIADIRLALGKEG
jgi:hypothetical protein